MTIDTNGQANGGTDFNKIPVIDLAAWWSNDLKGRQQLKHHVYEACTQVGFFYVKNHGIPDSVIDKAHEAARRFFSLPDEVKMKSYLGNSKKFHGYSPLFGEMSTGAGLDDPAERPDQACFSEAYDIGYETDGDATKKSGDPLPQDSFNLYGGNQWPREEECPGFRDDFLQFFAAALELSRNLMRIFAHALDLPEDFFDDKMKNPGSMGRMIHYPPQPIKEKALAGLSAHTDYECLTVLSQDHVPALQVLNNSGQWVLADPIPGTLVINISDCLGLWTNGRFKPTIHRVTNLTGQERYSVPFCFGVDYDATISVLENCITKDSPAACAPFKAGEYVRQKLARGLIGYGAAPPDPEVVKRIRAGQTRV